ncbi:hypothetical protein [Micromonospora sp. NPDC050695]|uniref:hypothetical protein n=1 Tax=Micromonospora sp. NPDC050695 TaxID=3154938 RepID=UPI00340A48FB
MNVPVDFEGRASTAGFAESDEEALAVLAELGRQWRQGQGLTAGQRVWASYAIGHFTALLADTVGEGQVDSATAMVEAVIGLSDAIEAMAALARWYAEVCARDLDLFRKPGLRLLRSKRHVRQYPAEFEARRRVADDAEAREFAQPASAAFSRLAKALEAAHSETDGVYEETWYVEAPSSPWPLSPAARPTALYFWYDADGLLLYIGITGDLATRQSSHAKRSSWSEFADHSKIRRFPSRPEAEAAEKAAIESERPLFNHQHNDTPEARQRLVAYLIEHGRMDLLAPAVSRG